MRRGWWYSLRLRFVDFLMAVFRVPQGHIAPLPVCIVARKPSVEDN